VLFCCLPVCFDSLLNFGDVIIAAVCSASISATGFFAFEANSPGSEKFTLILIASEAKNFYVDLCVISQDQYFRLANTIHMKYKYSVLPETFLEIWIPSKISLVCRR